MKIGRANGTLREDWDSKTTETSIFSLQLTTCDNQIITFCTSASFVLQCCSELVLPSQQHNTNVTWLQLNKAKVTANAMHYDARAAMIIFQKNLETKSPS